MEDIAELLFRRRAPNLPPKALADVLDRLIWMTDDNGKAICDTLRRWIESGDRQRAEVALEASEVFLFTDREKMVRAFDNLCFIAPELRKRCDENLSEWDAQHVRPPTTEKPPSLR